MMAACENGSTPIVERLYKAGMSIEDCDTVSLRIVFYFVILTHRVWKFPGWSNTTDDCYFKWT
jgi:hypothetical protein